MLTGPAHGGAREIERHRLARDREVERDAQRHVGDAVVVEEIIGAPGAVGKRAQIAAHLPRRAGAQLGERRAHRRLAPFVEQRGKPPRAEVERVDLALQVAIGAQRLAAVRLDDGENVVAELAARVKLHRRNQHAFLMALGRDWIVVARHVAADVVIMGDRGEETEQIAVAEERPHQLEVGEMRAALVWIVENVDVAVGEIAVARGFLDHRLDGERHHPDEYRQPGLALHQGFAGSRVVEAVRGVMRFGDDRIEGAAEQRRVHLVGDLFEPALQHG